MTHPTYGYYPDPSGQPTLLRLWDGAQWTGKTLKMPGLTLAPRPDPTWSPPDPRTRMTYEQSLMTSAVQMGTMTVTGWIIGGLLLVALLVAAICVVGLVLVA